MSGLDELYQEVILDHYKNPRNYGDLPEAQLEADGRNPLCGDHYKVFLTVEDGRVREVAFKGDGCAISKASASVMSEAVKGRTIEEVKELFKVFQGLVTGKESSGTAGGDGLGKLAVFSGVSGFPVRVKCAVLPWHTLQAALDGRDEPVSTEEE